MAGNVKEQPGEKVAEADVTFELDVGSGDEGLQWRMQKETKSKVESSKSKPS